MAWVGSGKEKPGGSNREMRLCGRKEIDSGNFQEVISTGFSDCF